jgi:sarcosine oxidase subunit beta
VGALVSRRDGFAEPYWTTRAFCAKAVQLGATLMEHSSVTAIERKHHLWRVRCGETVYEAAIVVNCSGAWGDSIAAMIGDTILLQAEAPTMIVSHRSRLVMTTERTIIDFKKLMISAQTVIDVFPIMQSVSVIRCWAGIEGIIPDQFPVIGRGPSAPGIFYAFGFSAHGFQLGPVVGKIMADLVTEGRTEFPIEAFRADHFTSE